MPGAAAHVAPLELELSKLLSAHLAEVEVQLFVPGTVVAVRPRSATAVAAYESFVALPDRPRPYGPRQAPIFDALSGYRALPLGARFGPRERPPVPRVDNERSTISFPAVHLRPHPYGRIRLDPIVLVVEAPAPAVITAEWWATSTTMDGAMRGQLPISIAETPLSLATVLTEPEAWQQQGKTVLPGDLPSHNQREEAGSAEWCSGEGHCPAARRAAG